MLWSVIDTCQNKVSPGPVSHDHIVGLILELLKVKCFLKLTVDQVLVFDWITGSCQANLRLSGPGRSESG